MDFDIIPFDDIQWGHRLGAGSFGSVYKGSYLGIDIAIKEVLPSTEYDVHKYFEREWRIMRECRHPNIVLFLGLSKAPDDDGRVFIISEFVPRGNLRQYILSPHPFPWRLRLSFATDVARAVAYLHARQCIHRDLKGENLLITSNERIKVTDFGFARITSRNAEEMRRMTYCGTDGYMSPEIINGLDFDLPTDVFSLGIIFIEIMSRRLVDSKTYTRQAPHFTPDPAEVRRRATPGCPPALIALAQHCTLEDPLSRPKMPEVLARLREIELDVLSRLDDPSSEHVGSIRLVHRGGKRAMPIFDGGDTFGARAAPVGGGGGGLDLKEEEDRQAEEDALRTLANLTLDISGDGASSVYSSAEGDADITGREEDKWRTARWDEVDSLKSFMTASSEIKGHERLLPSADSTSSFGCAGHGQEQGWSSFMQSHSSGDSVKDVMPGHFVQTASVLRAATPAPPLSSSDSDSRINLKAEANADADADGIQAEGDTEEEEGGSTMTIKGGLGSPSVPSLSSAADLPAQLADATTAPIKGTDQPASAGEHPGGEGGSIAGHSLEGVTSLENVPSSRGSVISTPISNPAPIQRKDQALSHQPHTNDKPDTKDSTAGNHPTTPSSTQLEATPVAPDHTAAAAGDKRSGGGALATHRFTLVDQSSAPLINGKKLSSNFTSTFAFAFLPRALTPSPSPHKSDSYTGANTSLGSGLGSNPAPGGGKCAVCAKKVGSRPGLQCDDCHVIVHVKCSHAAPRNCTG